MKHTFQKGYISLVAILSLLVLSVSLLLALPYLSIGESQQALADAQSEEVFALLEGCREDTLLQIVRDENYAGGTQTYSGADCSVSVEKNDTVWTVTFSLTKNGLTRGEQVQFDRSVGNPGVLTLQSWLEQ